MKWYDKINHIISKCMVNSNYDEKGQEEYELEAMTEEVARLSKKIELAYYNPVMANDMNNHQQECEDRIREAINVLEALSIYNKNFGF